jgi:hypothetical protein
MRSRVREPRVAEAQAKQEKRERPEHDELLGHHHDAGELLV